MKLFIAISLLFSMSAQAQGISAAQEYEAGFNLTLNKNYKEKDYKLGREWLEKADAHGDARAASALALTYMPGYGAKEYDYALAKKWFKKAAERGDAYAQWSLGHMYEQGQGVSQAEAIKWFQQASFLGSADAATSYGRMFLNGEGVKKDYAKAMEQFQKAAAKDNYQAMAFIGKMHEEGLGVSKNKDEAFKWYKKAYGKADLATQKVDGENKRQNQNDEVVCMCEQLTETLQYNIDREKEIGRKTGVVDKVKLYGLGQKLMLATEIGDKLRAKKPEYKCTKKYDLFQQSECVFKGNAN